MLTTSSSWCPRLSFWFQPAPCGCEHSCSWHQVNHSEVAIHAGWFFVLFLLAFQTDGADDFAVGTCFLQCSWKGCPHFFLMEEWPTVHCPPSRSEFPLRLLVLFGRRAVIRLLPKVCLVELCGIPPKFTTRYQSIPTSEPRFCI